MKQSCVNSVFGLICLAVSLQAATPTALNYQGRLTNAGGTAVPDGSYSAVFTIYDAVSGGTSKWTETQSVTTAGGLFAVLLGTFTPITDSVFNGSTRFLGVKVGSDPELSPRTPLVSAPYSDRVSTVDGSTGGSIAGNINLDNSTTTTGNLYKAGTLFLHNYGVANTFIGKNAGNLTLTGNNNTASGVGALNGNTSGTFNTALGAEALYSNTTGGANAASGYNALGLNTIGSNNTASGASALQLDTSGAYNTASGSLALGNNTAGNSNTATGFDALLSNTTGSSNTAVGEAADVASGTLTNASAFGANATVNTSNTMVLGSSSVVSWGFGVNSASGHAIQVGTGSSNGNGAYLTSGGTWTNTSDRNVKEGITLVDGSELLQKIIQLPVYRWNYKGEDPSHQHVGPMAQDFYAVFGLGDDDKHISTIDPSGVALASIQALNEKLNEQKAENADIKSENAELQARLEKVEAALNKLAGGASVTGPRLVSK